jgi:ribosomal protein S18 acetylase RimI-like enzyme
MPMDSLKNTRENMFNIEDAKPEDVEAIRTIVRDAWLEVYPNETHGITAEDISAIDWFNPEDIAKRKKGISENLGTFHIWVARDGKNKVVGFCKASKDGHKNNIEGQKEIDAMYVASEFKRKGIGKELMQKALEWLGTNSDVRLEVVSYNADAINFYKKFGFEERGKVEFYGGTNLPSGKELPRIEMVRMHNE